MSMLPRLSIGAVQASVDTQPMCWALMELFSRTGCQVQHFMSRACFSRLNGAVTVTGLTSRHLDSWLMPADLCREVFSHGCRSSDLGLVEGMFRPAGEATTNSGNLDTLCEWLDLPRVAVLDVSQLDGCCLPRRPTVDALLLDQVRDRADTFRWQTTLESLWGIPVLGSLEELPQARRAIAQLPRGSSPSKELCQELGNRLEANCRLDVLQRLSTGRDYPDFRPTLFSRDTKTAPGKRRTAETVDPAYDYNPWRPTTVAVAYDAAFNCYFPDTLDLLEVLGAEVVDFSPLHDEALPADTDVVYFGCGHPEQHAAALSDNHCMMLALRDHLCAGRRVYAEGGGLAYLCQHLQTPEGEWLPMIGALPALARFNPQPQPPQPVELTLAETCWLAQAGDRLRGYLNPNWILEPTGRLSGLLAEPGHELDFFSCYQALGSRLHLNFAAQPGFLQHFFEPLSTRSSAVAAR
jgi:cobyrinic acid a,c-diamide synthase